MTRVELEAAVRDARSALRTLWTHTTDPEMKKVANGGYRKLCLILRHLAGNR